MDRERPPEAIPLVGADGGIVAVTLIDAADHELVAQRVWRLSSHGYAVRSETAGGRRVTTYLHRVIAGTAPGVATDHINGNRLDNRRTNLRAATSSQNNANSRDRTRGSGFRGVYWHRQAERWVSQISVDGHLRHLGLFDDPEEAARAYDVAAREAWGPFARTNGFA